MTFKQSLTEEELDALLVPSLRLFLSVDIVGSTAFKQRGPDHSGSWLEFVHGFYTGFPAVLLEKVGVLAQRKQQQPPDAPPLLWKALGDELVFTALISHPSHAVLYLSAFREALISQIHYYTSGTIPLPISFKGTAWLAGFPVWNAAVPLDDDAVGQAATYDFVGPLIDVGFRLKSFSTPRKLVVSADLAWFLAKEKPPADIKFFYDGRILLKGVLNNRPYPVFWIDCLEKTLGQENYKIGSIEDQMLGLNEVPPQTVEDFTVAYLTELKGLIPLPFIDGQQLDVQPADFTQRLKQRRQELRRIYMGRTLAPPETPDVESDDRKKPVLEDWEPPP